MKKRLGILVVLLFGVMMVAYGLFTINEEKEVASQIIEKEIEMALVEIENNVSVYFETYENLMKDLSLNDEILYDEQETYKGLAHLDAIQVLHPELQYIYYGSETGKMFLSPEIELPEEFDPRERPWYLNALDSENVVWTEPYTDASDGDQTITSTLQIFDNHQLNGVLGFDLKLDQDIFRLKEDLSIEYCVIVSSEWGTIIYHKDGDDKELINLDAEILQGIEEGNSTFEYATNRTAFVRTNHLGWSIILTVSTDDLK